MTAVGEGPTKRSVTIGGHRTSVTLEPSFWDALERLAGRRGRSVAALVAEIDAERTARAPEVGLASALRVAILRAALAGEV